LPGKLIGLRVVRVPVNNFQGAVAIADTFSATNRTGNELANGNAFFAGQFLDMPAYGTR